MKHTILFDMDGTTFDFATPLCELIQQTKTLPEEVRKRLDNISKFTKVGLHELFDPAEFDISHIEYTIKNLYQNEQFFSGLKLYPGIKDFLEELALSHHVRFCTKPSEDHTAKSESAKRASIIRELGPTRSTSMITTHDKTGARGRLLFDDSPLITGISQPEWQHIIVDQPHNQGILGTRVYHSNLEEWKNIIKSTQ